MEISDDANTLMLTPLVALWAFGVCGRVVCGGGDVCGGSGARRGIAVMGFVFVYGPELLFICIDFRTNPAIRFRVGVRPILGVEGSLDE